MNRGLSLSSLALLASKLFKLNAESNVCAPAELVVGLSYGSFQGNIAGNVTQFLGIPFAQPPVGDLRFREAMEPMPFVGLRMANNFGAACPQQTLAPIPGFNFTGNYGSISEDCLTINVLKPVFVDHRHKLPVAVWFHGGGFEIGDSSDTIMNSIIERSIYLDKPVIVVIPNYRVNAFGFLAGKEVKAAGIGNLGLRDQRFALEWVQEHISKFGGDPNHVVISGLSAGAISVGMHLVSSHAQHFKLFHGAFMESGSTSSIPSIFQGQSQYDQLVMETNCGDVTDTLDCLRHAPFDTLMSAINQTPNVFSYSSLGNVWKPRIDGEVLDQDPYIVLSHGLHAKVPIIAGNCDDEGTLFSFANMNITTNQAFLEYMHNNYFPQTSWDRILDLGVKYPADPAAVGSPFGTGVLNAITPEFKRLAAVQGDILFQGPRRNLLKTVSRTQDTWGFLYKRGKAIPTLGVSHGSDVKEWLARNVSDFFGIDSLIQFINTLDPNSPVTTQSSSIVWPQWNTAKAGALMSFSDPSGLEIILDDFRSEPISFLNDMLIEIAQN